MRPGDNKWTTTLFARDADTGQARWAYQMNPHDLFDHDGVNENVLVDVTMARARCEKCCCTRTATVAFI